MKQKTIVGGIIGGVVFFLLGWLFYGIIMKDAMKDMGGGIMRSETDMMGFMWAMIVSNLVWGYAFAVIFDWGGINSAMSGLTKGAFIGFLICLSIDLGFYAMSTWFKDMGGMIMDVVTGTIMSAAGGAFIGWWLGRGANAAA